MGNFIEVKKGQKNVNYDGYINGGDDNLKVSNFSKISLDRAKNNKVNQVAIDTFNRVSRYGEVNLRKTTNISTNDFNLLVSENVTYFLYALGIVSAHEGNLNSINTYDNGGLSVGTIQLANPTDGNPLMDFLKILDTGVYNKVKDAFNQGSDKNNYSDPKSLKARLDLSLLKELYTLLTSAKGWEAQFEIIIKKYYDPAFERFLSVVKPKLVSEGSLLVYASAFCFEAIVQNPSQFFRINEANMKDFLIMAGNKPHEGHFCYYFSNKKIDLNNEARDNEWNGLTPTGPLVSNFEISK